MSGHIAMQRMVLGAAAGVVAVCVVGGASPVSGGVARPPAFVECTKAPGERTEAQVVWHEAPASPGVFYAVTWDAPFQTYDVLWKNTRAEPVRLVFSADSVTTAGMRAESRELQPGEAESLPGHSVAPRKATGDVCVRVEVVR